MNMNDWAENEIQLAIENEKKASNNNPDDYTYGVSCYENALKAYKCLDEDGHSGYSWGITASILERLMKGKPLLPIEDTPDIWEEVHSIRKDKKEYQCKRYASLFKTVDIKTGEVSYNDSERVYGCPIDDLDLTYCGGGVSIYANRFAPITMSYMPTTNKIKVVTDDFHSDPNRVGEFDHMAYLYMVVPTGTVLADGTRCEDPKRIDIEEYFKQDENWRLVKISRTQYFAEREIAMSKKENNYVRI